MDNQPHTVGSSSLHAHLVDSAWKQVEAMWPTLVANGGSSAIRSDLRELNGAPTADALPGYRIAREIHRGGQGVVYEALQQSTGRTVAIKVTRQGPFSGRAGRLRFEREVQVLAQLKHPGIVTIYDSGQVPGWDYFVMDYIEGLPLDRYMEARKPSVRDRLLLFARCCTAVNVAHLHGVIHRDLKPGNIRVDASGEPHVLDFGLAKLVDPLLDDQTEVTLSGQFVGSMPWASPEQAEGRLADLDVRTDVYSLGVLLYQLLTGHFPYDVTGSIRDVSDRIARDPPADPRRFNGELDDELATIVLTCLRKEPERRYQNAGDIGRDVERYLRREPIEAKRDSFAYVLRKQLARYRLAALTLSAFVVVALAGLIASITFWSQAVQARDAEAGQKVIAEKRAREAADEAAKARAVSTFLTDLLGAADPFGGDGRDVRVADTLDAAAARMNAGTFRDQPDTEVAVRQALGESYGGLGLYEAAAEQFEAARQRLTPRLGTPAVDREWTICTNGLGVILRQMDRTDEAEARLGEALTFGRERVGPKSDVVAQSLSNLASIARDRTKFAESAALFEEALAILESDAGHDKREYGRILGDFGTLAHVQGEYEQARERREKSLAILREVHGPTHPSVATALANLGSTLAAQGDFAAAETVQREAVDVARQVYGEAHPEFPSFLNNLGNTLSRRGKQKEAERLMREALKLKRRVLGPGHPGLVTSINNVATVAFAKGAIDEAAELLEEAVELQRSGGRADDRTILTLLSNLAGIRRMYGEYEACEQLLGESIERGVALLGEEHVTVASSRTGLGLALAEMGRFAEAEEQLCAALAIQRARFGEQHPETLTTLGILGRMLGDRGDSEQAELVLRDVLAARHTAANVVEASQALNDLALVVARRDLAEAEALCRKALEIRRAAFGDDHTIVLDTRCNLAGILRRAGRVAEAEAMLREVIAAGDELFPVGHPHRAMYAAQQGLCLMDLGRLDEAERALVAAHEILSATWGASHWRAREVAGSLATVCERLGRAEDAAEWRARAAE